MVPARLLRNLMMSLARWMGAGAALPAKKNVRGVISRFGFARNRLYRTTMRSTLSICRLYS